MKIFFAGLMAVFMLGAVAVPSNTAYAGGGGAPAEETNGLQFVKMDPMLFPIIDDNGVSQVISLVITLEVKDYEAAKEVKQYAPRLTDAYLQDMYGALNKRAALKGGVLHISMIKDRLTKVSKKIMGEGKIKDVLLQVVSQNPV